MVSISRTTVEYSPSRPPHHLSYKTTIVGFVVTSYPVSYLSCHIRQPLAALLRLIAWLQFAIRLYLFDEFGEKGVRRGFHWVAGIEACTGNAK